jgi:rhamnosyltransferase
MSNVNASATCASASTAATRQPKVLVLLAAYNGANWIGEQIESILRQSCVDVTLVVRDDGSTDSTASAVHRLTEVDARVRFEPAGIPSGAAAQNFFSLIRSNCSDDYDFVALSDQDDIWNDDKLCEAVEALGCTQSSGYSSPVTAIWPSGRTRVLYQEKITTESDFFFEGAGQGCTFVLSGKLYDRIRLFLIEREHLTRNIHFHDWTIYALTRVWGLNWVFGRNSAMFYRQHELNDTGARLSWRGISTRIARIRCGWYRSQLLAISEICLAAKPLNPIVVNWNELLAGRPTWRRRSRIVCFCIKGGRRRTLDNAILILCTLIGWI